MIGITGPIGCGKSTVAGWLAGLGALVIDADRVARSVTPPGSDTLAAVVEAFGSGVLAADGSLDRAELGRIVFADPEALRRLESIIHPAVRPAILAEIEAARAAGALAVAVEAIKLVEGGLAWLCDEVWLVTCAPYAQVARVRARAAARGQSPKDATARVAAQAGLTDRLRPHATRVIDTSGSVDTARSTVAKAFAEALRTATIPT
ncbi:MAG TPA: dephospho-CoA kinase [Candidatus Limnocylindrales bacterium]|nr:dephospho-CoA kinase [Candidatus Limnocylindrales bacterium]